MRVDQFEQLVVHGFCFFFFPALQRFGRAMMQVILHQVARHAAQRFLHGSNLRDDVRAVAVFFHHFLQAADLALDAAQAVLIGFLQIGIDPDSFASAGRGIAGAIRRWSAPIRLARLPSNLRSHSRHDTLHPYIYPLSLYIVKRLTASLPRGLPRAAILRAMTLVEITYELQSPLTEEQLRQLGQFANTYGLRSFRVDEATNRLSFEYDASRLRETQVAHVLGQARIAIKGKVN